MKLCKNFNFALDALVPYGPDPFEILPKLPILVHNYAGPGFNFVTNKFEIGWDEFLVTNRSIGI